MHLTRTEEAEKCRCVLHGRIISTANIWLTGLLIVSVEMHVVLRAYWKAVRKEGSAGMFFSERPQCWKGHGRHKNGSERSWCYSVGPLQSMLPHPHSLSVTLIFSLLIISVTLSLISIPHHLISVAWETHCGWTELIWNWSIMLLVKKKSFFRNHTNAHVNLPIDLITDVELIGWQTPSNWHEFCVRNMSVWNKSVWCFFLLYCVLN